MWSNEVNTACGALRSHGHAEHMRVTLMPTHSIGHGWVNTKCGLKKGCLNSYSVTYLLSPLGQVVKPLWPSLSQESVIFKHLAQCLVHRKPSVNDIWYFLHKCQVLGIRKFYPIKVLSMMLDSVIGPVLDYKILVSFQLHVSVLLTPLHVSYLDCTSVLEHRMLPAEKQSKLMWGKGFLWT